VKVKGGGKTGLELGDQVGGLGYMKCAGCNKEYVVSTDHPVPCVYRGALDYRQDVSLNTLARDVRSTARLPTGNFVDFIEKDDPVILNALDGCACDLIHVD